MSKKIVIALGGNALGNNLKEQMAAVKTTVKIIADLIQAGNNVVISHGNGPQAGMIHEAMAAHEGPLFPMTMCVAMSQGYIGYDLQNLLREELLNRGIHKPVATIVTQVVVHADDPAFTNPTKPIGRFMAVTEATAMREKGIPVMEDAGRGYRMVVPSPRPHEIVEIESIRALSENGHIVIAAGGGGISVCARGNHLKGVSAIVDKDFTSCVLARRLHADCLVILTAVEKVAVNFGKKDQQWLNAVTPEQMRELVRQGHFAPGSMLPKVQAAIEFAASNPECYALITHLKKAHEALEGKTGTIIRQAKRPPCIPPDKK
jgi:carbamate kinase